MLCKGHPSGLGQEGGQCDALGLQLLVQGVEFIGGDGVAYTEFWDLAMQRLSIQNHHLHRLILLRMHADMRNKSACQIFRHMHGARMHEAA